MTDEEERGLEHETKEVMKRARVEGRDGRRYTPGKDLQKSRYRSQYVRY